MTWHILRTEPQGELRAYRWLTYGRACGAEEVERTYLPLERNMATKRQGRSHRPFLTRPMLPSYLFVKTNPEASWAKIRDTPGIVGLLMLAGQVATLSEMGMEALRNIEAELQKPAHKRSCCSFKVGDRVRIKEGAFSGYEAILSRLDKRDRATLDLVLPGRGTLRDASVQWLEAV